MSQVFGRVVGAMATLDLMEAVPCGTDGDEEDRPEVRNRVLHLCRTGALLVLHFEIVTCSSHIPREGGTRTARNSQVTLLTYSRFDFGTNPLPAAYRMPGCRAMHWFRSGPSPSECTSVSMNTTDDSYM